MSTAVHGSTWDPNIVGPLDRCLRCWTPVNNDVAYCLTCGKATMVFTAAAAPPEGGQSCVHHPGVQAQRFCCLCMNAICEQCNGNESFSFTMGSSLWHCRPCCQEAERLEKQFFAVLSRDHCCSKHRDTQAAFECKKCSLPLCLSCTYFTVKGWLRKTVADGPFCIGCFRTWRPRDRNGNQWFSGDVAPHFVPGVAS